ncbi:MAG: hypothetical protein AAFW84_22040, partial [Cyanobacteria bacterium J06635_15]
ALATINGWNYRNINTLATAINAGNAGGLTGIEIATLAGLLPNNDDSGVLALARLAGWGFADVRHLAEAINRGTTAGRSASQVAAIASLLPVNDDEGALALARISRFGWKLVQITNLATAINTDNAGKRSAFMLAGIARSLPNDAGGVLSIARLPWHFKNIHTLATAISAGNAGGLTGTQIATLAGLLPPNKHLDTLALATINGWNYRNINTLATAINAGNAGGLTGIEIATLAGLLPPNDDPGTLALAQVPNVTQIYPLVRHLLTRQGATSLNISALLQSPTLAAFSTAELQTLLTNRLPDLSIDQLHTRINTHGLPGGLASSQLMLNQLNQDNNSLDQSLQARNVPPAIQNEAKIAFQLRNWRSNQVTQFLGYQHVVNDLQHNNYNRNPVRWLYWFAIYHQAPSALPNNNIYRQVNVNHTNGNRNVNINGWIINHVRNRHTFHNFDFGNAALLNHNQRQVSTMFIPPTPNNSIEQNIENILGNLAVQNGVWDGRQIQVGSYEIRIEPDPNNVGEYRISSFFFGQVAGVPIDTRVLNWIHQLGLF